MLNESPDAPPRASGLSSRGLIVALIIGAVIRAAQLVWASKHVPDFLTPMLDAGFHHHWASVLVDSNTALPAWMDDPELATTPYYRPPGYVWLLAALYAVFGTSPWAAHVAQALVGLVGIALVFSLTRAVSTSGHDDDERPSMAPTAAALLYALSPALLYFEGELVAASVASVLVTGWVGLFLHFDRSVVGRANVFNKQALLRAVGLGALLGLLCLVRPNLLVLLGPAAFLVLWSGGDPNADDADNAISSSSEPSPGDAPLKQRVLLVAALLVGVVASTAPVTVRNWRVGGEAVWVSMNGPITARYGNHDDADGHHVRLPTTGVLAGLTEVSASGYPRVREHVAKQLGRGSLAWGDLSDTLRRETTSWALAHPGRFLSLLANKALLLVGPVEVSNNKQVQLAIDESPVLRWLPGRWSVLAALALLGALALVRRRRRDLVLVGGSVLLVLGAVVPFLAAGRFRAPVLGLLACLAGLGVQSVVRLVQSRRGADHDGRSTAGLSPPLAVGASVVGVLVFGVSWTGYAPDAARFHLDRATALIRAQHDDEALLALDQALSLDPRDAEALRRRGLLRGRQGAVDQAVADLEASVAAGGGEASQAALATVRAQRGDVDGSSLQAFEALLKQDPGRPDTLYNYALALFGAGRLEDAKQTYQRLLEVDPGHVDGRNNLGRAMLALGDPAGALAAFEGVLQTEPDHEEAGFNRAVALGRVDAARAEDAYRALLAKAPDHVGARTNLGALLLDSGRAQEAAEVMAPAASASANVGLLFNYARACWLSGDEARATATLRQARARRQQHPADPGPGPASVDLLLADWLINSRSASVRDPAEAVSLTRAVVEGARWSHPIPIRAYGAALAAAGDAAAAKEAAAKADALCAAQPQAFGDACP